MFHHYPLQLRLEPLASLLGCGCVGLAVLRVARQPAVGYDAAGHETILFAVATFVMILLIWNMRRGWFLLHAYRMTDTSIEEYDPILRRRSVVAFDNVIEVRDFALLTGGDKHSTWRRGHALIARDGSVVRLCEALRIWPDVAARVGAQRCG